MTYSCHEATGSSKTLLNSQTSFPRLEAGIDYLTLIYGCPSVDYVRLRLDVLAGMFADAWEIHPGQGRYVGKQYANQARSARGMLATWNLPGESGEPEGSLRLSIPGSVCSSISLSDLISVIKHAIEVDSATVSRIDFKVDDYAKLVSFAQIEEAYHSGNYARFRVLDPREKFRSGRSLGRTLYLGTRDSQRHLRVYDANTKHQIDAIRWEVEMKRELAEHYASVLCSLDLSDMDAVRNFIRAAIVGTVEFVDRSSGTPNLSRCPRLDWWQAFVDALGGSLRLSIPAPQAVLEKTMRFLDRLSATFATVATAVGRHGFFEYMRTLVEYGETKMSHRHYAMLSASRAENKWFVEC